MTCFKKSFLFKLYFILYYSSTCIIHFLRFHVDFSVPNRKMAYNVTIENLKLFSRSRNGWKMLGLFQSINHWTQTASMDSLYS